LHITAILLFRIQRVICSLDCWTVNNTNPTARSVDFIFLSFY